MRLNMKPLRAAALGTAMIAAPAAPALASTWVPGHYAPNGAYIPGHWVGTAAVWVEGHYAPNGVWIPGHWAGGVGPRAPYDGPPGPAPYGSHWIPGHYSPNGEWHPGHWTPN